MGKLWVLLRVERIAYLTCLLFAIHKILASFFRDDFTAPCASGLHEYTAVVSTHTGGGKNVTKR